MRDENLSLCKDFLDSWLEYHARQDDIPGFCVSIMHSGRMVFSRAYGYANSEFGIPLTTKHLFSVASQTKMFTATAILILSQEGKLSIADPISKYLPWLKKHTDSRAARITVKQLLNHSSGLAHDPGNASFWDFNEPFPNSRELHAVVLAAHITTRQQSDAPKYSNLGYCLLGEIVSRVSGESYASFIKSRILVPLQLNETYVDFKARYASNTPNGYTIPYDRTRQTILSRKSTKAMTPSVGIYATTDDMCRYLTQVLSNASPLAADTRALARATQTRITNGIDSGVTFGLGLRIRQIDGRYLLGHDGHLAGHVSATFYDEDTDTTVAIATNAQDAPIMQMSNGIFRAVQWFREGDPTADREMGYDIRLRNRMSSVQVVANGKRIVSIDPDSWDPFSRAENLSPVDPNTLRITTQGSLMNTGEIVTYQFGDDVVERVNFTGITMVNEAHYYGQKLDDITLARSRNWLSLQELQHATLKAGRVVNVELCRGIYQYKLLVDYGEEIGTRYAFLKQLPHGVPAAVLLNRSVLAAVFNVWQFHCFTKEVLVLGLGLDQRINMPFTIDRLLSLEADPESPRTMWASEANEQIRQISIKTEAEAFKFQALPEYEQDECDSAYVDSFHAWKVGNIRKSKALLHSHKIGDWRRDRVLHLIVTDDTPTPYQLWSIEVAKAVAIPQGEKTYTLPRKYLAGVIVPNGDFTIWDDKQVTVNGYSGSQWTHTTIYANKAGEGVSDFLELKGELIKRALRQGTKL